MKEVVEKYKQEKSNKSTITETRHIEETFTLNISL